MNRLHSALALVSTSLLDFGVHWALIGGLGVAARSEPRFTRDIDIAVAMRDDEQAEGLVFSLSQRGFDKGTAIEQERVGRLSTMRLRFTHSEFRGILVDLLFASSGIEPEIVDQADVIEIVDGIKVPIAQTGHLLALKVLSQSSDRPQDEIDIKALLEHSGEEDLSLARTAVELIMARGFNRGRKLDYLLDRWISKYC